MPCLNTPVPEKAKPFPLQSPFICPSKSAATTNAHHHHRCIPLTNSRPSHLSGSDGLAHAGTTLSRVQATLLTRDNSLGLLDDLLSLGEDQLDVAGVGHVGVDLKDAVQLIFRPCSSLGWYSCQEQVGFLTYTTVGTVGSSALLGSLVDLDVLDNQVASVKTLGVGVGLGVLQELEEELGRLDGPSGAGNTPLLAYLSSYHQSQSLIIDCFMPMIGI